MNPTAAMIPTTVPRKFNSKMSPVPMRLAMTPPTMAPATPSSSVSPSPIF